jgi:hypothetical protein
MRRVFLFVAVAAVLLCGVLTFAPARELRVVAAPAWEYRVLMITDIVNVQQAFNEPAKAVTAVEVKFNELGRDGWELCQQLNGVVVFKRGKP